MPDQMNVDRILQQIEMLDAQEMEDLLKKMYSFYFVQNVNGTLPNMDAREIAANLYRAYLVVKNRAGN